MSTKPPPLPDTSRWQPTKVEIAPSIAEALIRRCKDIEGELAVRVAKEKESAMYGFDSGVPVEDIIRESFANLLPTRYSVSSGVAVDSSGSTAGDVDVVVFNATWFPQLRPSATPLSRRRLLPVEGIYAVGEVKQTLTFATLDAALAKLVRCHRLVRDAVPRNRLTENRQLEGCDHGISNPLYSFVLAATAEDDLQSLVERFFDVNRSLKRSEVIRALCVLGKGTVVWALRGERESRPALFAEGDLSQPIVPAFFPVEVCPSPLYALVANLMTHLYKSVLGPEDIFARYGPSYNDVRLPSDPNIYLAADDA